jgi:hypothetical protein
VQQPVTKGPSDRVRVAQIARETALAMPDVVDLDPGLAGRYVTIGGGIRVAGVISVVAPEGGYDVSLRLVCEMVALHPLADRVRTAIQSATVDAGLVVASVSIHIAEIAEPGSV